MSDPGILGRRDGNRSLLTGIIGRASIGRYAAIGVTGVSIDFFLFVGLVHLGLIPVLATTISTLAGITNNYILNSKLNFRTTPGMGSGVRFLTVGLAGLAISAALLQVLIHVGTSTTFAKAITIPVVVTLQFLANKYWSFRGDRGTAKPRGT